MLARTQTAEREIVVVGFAGGGGSCEGIRRATGHSPDVAINHDEFAVAMHRANHPDTIHYCQNIYKANPTDVLREVKRARKLKRMPKIGFGWFSPDCKHFSKAKGGKPVEKNIRDLAWVILAWARLPKAQRPRIIEVENVEEFLTWGPLLGDGTPDPDQKGKYFRRWFGEFRKLGYAGEWRVQVAANKGAPTTRKRLYIIFREDGEPIAWRDDRFAPPASPYVISGARKPWRTAAECIDWSLPCPSIFETSAEIFAKHGVRAQRPLVDNTMARVARGTFRYVLEHPDPFIVPVTHTGDARFHPVSEPLRTITTAQRGEHALITPFVTKFNSGSIGHDAREPLHTITAAQSATHPGGAVPLGIVTPFLSRQFGESIGSPANDPTPTIMPAGQGKTALVAAFLAQHNTDMVGHDAREPVSTIVGKGCTQAVVSAGLLSLKGSERRGGDIRSPAPAITAGGWHVAEVRAFLTKFHGTGGQWQDLRDPLLTIDTHDRFGLVTVTIRGETYVIYDIGMRMLTPRELFRAQGFPDSYIIDRGLWGDGSWRPLSKTHQIRMVGNSVCPDVACDHVAANYVPQFSSDDARPFFLEAAE